MRPWEGPQNESTSNDNIAASVSLGTTLNGGRYPVLPAPRVSLHDAAELDLELYDLVRKSVLNSLLSLSKINSTDLNDNNTDLNGLQLVLRRLNNWSSLLVSIPVKYDLELNSMLRFLLFGIPLIKWNSSLGSQLQNLVYRNERRHQGSFAFLHTIFPINAIQKSLFVIGIVLGPYISNKFYRYMQLNHWEEDDNQTKKNQKLSFIEQIYCITKEYLLAFKELTSNSLTKHSKYLIYVLYGKLELIFQSLKLLHLLLFLFEGKYLTMLERFLSMRLVLKHREINHSVSFEFMNRQIVWNTFTDFIMFILPYIDISKLKRKLNHSFITASSLLNLAIGTNENKINSELTFYKNIINRYPDICGICLKRNLNDGSLLENLKKLSNSTLNSNSDDFNSDISSNDSDNDSDNDDYSKVKDPLKILEENLSNFKKNDLLKNIISNIPYKSNNCNHIFCYHCIKFELMNDPDSLCPICNQNLGPNIIPKWESIS